QKEHEIFIKKVRFLLNIPAGFGIIHTAIEMAGIQRSSACPEHSRRARRKLQRSKVLVSADTPRN
ncbi:MAG: hypothetical protein ACYSU3_24615, partial [Planctomycetota bacterium]